MSGKHPYIKEISGEQRRQLIDARQVFEAYELARGEFRIRYEGSMRWGERAGAEYLLYKRGRSEKSLGAYSAETETIYQNFLNGRETGKKRLEKLSARMDELARINVAMEIARVPLLTARIIRRLSDARLLGGHLFVIGTNALYAYEASAGAFIESSMLATGDADLLMDARRRLGLAFDSVKREGIIGLLQKVDKSFTTRGGIDYHAVNSEGFFVDLIRPEDGKILNEKKRERIGDGNFDLCATPIKGLNWLINAPKFSAIAIDEKGYPLRIETIDPRIFALHKAWVSEQQGRDPLKVTRDRAQAEAIAFMSTHYLNLSFHGSDLSALPAELRAKSDGLLQSFHEKNTPLNKINEIPTPKW
jgi:hypothetical protein